MKIPAENYKGIEFVRISALPEDQKLKIETTFRKHRIIKILKEKELLADCIQFSDYNEWYSKIINKAEKTFQKAPERRKLFVPVFNSKKVFK